MIDRQQASEALSEINEIAGRVRQSRIYNIASMNMIMWGAMVFAGYSTSYLMPRMSGLIWIAIYVAGMVGSFVISRLDNVRHGVRTFDLRALAAFALFVAFGIFCSMGLGHFTPRQLGTFWPIYFMLVYTIAGLWVGRAFVAIGLSVALLTLVGYFFLGNSFDLWMAFVDGGGLVLGGLWMRRS